MKFNIKNQAKNLRGFILDLLFPIECVSCKKEGDFLCTNCLEKLKYNEIKFCLNCGQWTSGGEFCDICRPAFELDGILIAGNYGDKILAELIKLYKYRLIADIHKNLSLFLANYIKIYCSEHKIFSKKRLYNTIIIPVPLHKKRKNWRGFNQSDLLAKDLSVALNAPYDNSSLIRINYRKPQTKFKKSRRIANIKGCFKWSAKNSNLTGKNIILIDDVTTTGSTLNECAKILKQNGAKSVWGVVIAKN